jgi:N-hydroxyarylamine O-acetyltransferase
MFDLEAYFSRIGYVGTREPSLATLAAIHRHHVRAIPFENLDVLLGRSIRIDLSSITEKLIHGSRGGYCFEQNALLRAALTAIGFRVTPHMARVRWQVPPETETALTHMLLRVETGAGPHLCDVGFGSMSLVQPLTFEFDVEQPGPFEPRRLVRRSSPDVTGLIVQQVRIGEEWMDVYQFSLDPAPAVDFDVGNWFTSTHPHSRFRQNMIVARCDETHRCTLINREFTIRHADSRVEKRLIASPEELLSVLEEHFRLHFPAGTRFGTTGAAWPV